MNTPPRSFAAPPPSLPADKARARALMREARRALHRAEPEAGARAAQAFAAWPLPPAATVAVYTAFGSEIDAEPLARALAARGAVTALPVVTGPGGRMVFRRLREGDLLAPDAAGVPAPDARAATVSPSLVFAPLLAFDRRGGRLGQGGGHYDRAIAALRAADASAIVFGLAFAGQEVDSVPIEPHDARLDGVLTPEGLRTFQEQR